MFKIFQGCRKSNQFLRKAMRDSLSSSWMFSVFALTKQKQTLGALKLGGALRGSESELRTYSAPQKLRRPQYAA